MAEDDKTAGTQGGPEPSLSVEELGTAIQENVRKVLAEQIATAQDQGYGRREEPPPADTREPSANPLMDMIAPHLAPAFRRLGIAVSSAEDAAIFYGAHPDAVEYRADVEKATKAMHEQGIPLAREAIWDWYRGKNEDKFTESRAARVKAAEEAAARASGVGAGAPNLTPEISALAGKEATQLTDEELELVLKGKGGSSPISF